MSDDEAGNAGCEHAGEAREHEAVVQYEAADFVVPERSKPMQARSDG